MNPIHSKTILFYLNHPAHYHLFKNVINRLKAQHVNVKVLIVKKDVLEDLVRGENWEYENIFPRGRRIQGLPVLLNTMFNFVLTEIRLFRVVRRLKPQLMIGSEGTLAHTSWLLRIPYFLFNEDDTKASPQNYLVYPFLTKLICPQCTDRGQWEYKKITHNSFHELAYLHPNYFTAKEEVVLLFNPTRARYFILRLVALTASHDAGKTGIDDDLARRIIAELSRFGKVWISAERPLREEFEQYRLPINPKDIFHALAFADLCVGDSQTMIAEAAVLGTPAIRFNDFVERLSYLQELEETYQLAFGIPTRQPENLFAKIEELLKQPDLKAQWQKKRDRLLREKEDLTEFTYNLIDQQLNVKMPCAV